MNQSELPFDARKLARSTDPATSKAAAKACKELRGVHHQQILSVLQFSGRESMTCDEIAEQFSIGWPEGAQLDRVQVGKRMHELEKLDQRQQGARRSATRRWANGKVGVPSEH